MITSAEKKQLESDLKHFDNVGDVLTYLNSKYDLKKAKLGIMTKPQFIDGMIKAINTLNPPKRNE